MDWLAEISADLRALVMVCWKHVTARKKCLILLLLLLSSIVEVVSPLASPFSQAISEHCETTDTGWCMTRYVCLLSQLSPGNHSSLPLRRLRVIRYTNPRLLCFTYKIRAEQ